jgi:simple sugar transport system permease protein
MIATGYNPGDAFSALGLGALLNFDQVLWRATPLMLAGLSVALAFKCGLFNIGAEGQLYMGSLAATAVGYMIALPIIVHQLACIAVGVAAGLLYGLVPGILRAYRGAHEVVTTMMLSYASVYFTQWMVSQGPMHNPGDWRSITPVIFDSAILPKLFGSSFLSWGFIVAVVCVFIVDIFINRTVMGYEMRAVGSNEDAARTAGVNAKKNVALALGLSGALAGLAGTVEVQGYYHRFYDQWSAGLGFDGITVAVLGRNNPWGVFGGALFFGGLKAGGTFMQTNAGVPSEMVQVIQGLVVLFVAAPRLITWLSKHGVDYATWIKSEPKAGVPSLLAFGYAVFGALMGIIVVSPYVSSNFSLLLLGFFISMASMAVMVFHYQRDKRRTSGTIAVSLSWVLMLLAGLALSAAEVMTVSLMMAGIGLILSMLLKRTQSDRLELQEEGI